MTVIRYGALPHDPAPPDTNKIATDGSTTSYSTIKEFVDAGRPYASQAEAEAGSSQVVGMNPLRTAQAISALGASLYASVAQGALAATAIQPAELDAVRVPMGGSTGQVLGKVSAVDNDVTWQNAGAGDVLASNNLSDLANIATARTNLGLAIGTNVQAWDADLDALAANGTPGTAGKAVLLKSTAADINTYLGFHEIYLSQYGVAAANSAATNSTLIQALLDSSAANTIFIFPEGLIQITTLTVWKSGHRLVGAGTGTTIYSTSPRSIRFVASYLGVACPDLIEEYWESGTTASWSIDTGGSVIPVSGGKLTGTGTFRYYRDITVPVGAPVSIGAVISAGSTLSLRLYDGAAFTTPYLQTPTSSVVTITIASPGVVTLVGHGLSANQPVTLSTTGALPTGLTASVTGYAGTTYYVKTVLSADTFTLSATAGGTVIATTGTQSGVHRINTIQEVVTTNTIGPGWIYSATGTIRVMLYSPGSVTGTVDYVNARVGGVSYRQAFTNFSFQQAAAGTYPLLFTGSVEDVTISDITSLNAKKLIVMGDACATSAYINIYRVNGTADQTIATSFIEGRNGVNMYLDRNTVRCGLYTGTAAGRTLLSINVTYPCIWDEVVIMRTDTSGWYDAYNFVIRPGPQGGSQRTAIGPILEQLNVFDSCRRSVWRIDVGAGCYVKEPTLGNNSTNSCFEGDAYVLTGAGQALAPILGGGGTQRTRATGRSGLIIDIAKVSGMQIGGTYHDLDYGSYGNAVGLTLTGNSNWDGVQVDGFTMANDAWIVITDFAAYGLVVDGASAIKNLIVTPNNRFVGTTLKVSLNTPPEGATSLIASNVGRNKSSGAVTVTASPMTIAAVAWNRSIKVAGGTVSRIDVGPAASWYTTTDHDFFLPAGQTAAVTYTVAPTITATNW